MVLVIVFNELCASQQALDKHLFSEKSDVWSFGVLLWEIFSLGSVPFSVIHTNSEVHVAIVGGKQLLQPNDCPTEVYQRLMLACWAKKPADRPAFQVLVTTVRAVQTSLLTEEAVGIVHRESSERLRRIEAAIGVVGADVKTVGAEVKTVGADVKAVGADVKRVERIIRDLADQALPGLVCLLPLEKRQQRGFLRSVASLSSLQQYAGSLFNNQAVLHLLSEGNEHELPHFVPEHPGFLLK